MSTISTNTQYVAVSALLIERGYQCLSEYRPAVLRGDVTHVARFEVWHQPPLGLQVLLLVWAGQGVKAYWDKGVGQTGATLADLEAGL